MLSNCLSAACTFTPASCGPGRISAQAWGSLLHENLDLFFSLQLAPKSCSRSNRGMGRSAHWWGDLSTWLKNRSTKEGWWMRTMAHLEEDRVYESLWVCHLAPLSLHQRWIQTCCSALEETRFMPRFSCCPVFLEKVKTALPDGPYWPQLLKLSFNICYLFWTHCRG